MEEWILGQKSNAPNTLALQLLFSKPDRHWKGLLMSPLLLFHLAMGLGNLCVAGKASGPLSLWLSGRWPCLDHMGKLAHRV